MQRLLPLFILVATFYSKVRFGSQVLACWTGRQTFILYKKKFALVCQQLRCGDVLNGDRVMRGIRNDGIAVCVVVGRGQESGHVCKDRLADLDRVRCGVEVRNGDLAKIRGEDECVLARCHGEVSGLLLATWPTA
jgi:hypothetical protein